MRNAACAKDDGPLDGACSCYTCTEFTRAFLRHLFNAEEILGLSLVSLHNVHFFMDLLRAARQAILDGSFEQWRRLPLAQRLPSV